MHYESEKENKRKQEKKESNPSDFKDETATRTHKGEGKKKKKKRESSTLALYVTRQGQARKENRGYSKTGNPEKIEKSKTLNASKHARPKIRASSFKLQAPSLEARCPFLLHACAHAHAHARHGSQTKQGARLKSGAGSRTEVGLGTWHIAKSEHWHILWRWRLLSTRIE